MENKTVFWNLELAIKPGKLQDLITLAADMSAATKSNEPNALNYEWSIDPEKQSCHIYERYADSDAVMTHLGNFQAFADRFFGCLDVTNFHVYGQPDEKVKEALSGLNAKFYDQIGGFAR